MTALPRLALGKIRVPSRHRRNLGDLSALMASLTTIGLLHPIVITKGNRLVAGERRIGEFSERQLRQYYAEWWNAR